MEVLKEDSPKGMEEEQEEKHIRQCLKEIKEIGKRRNSLYQQVLQEEVMVHENHCIEPLLLQPPQTIALPNRVVWDPLMQECHYKVFQ